MRLPQEIIVRVVVRENPVEGLLIRVSIPMKRKNDYGWLIGPSGPDGRIAISGEDLRQRIQADRKLFIMDSVDAESYAKGEMRLAVPRAGAIDAAVAAFDVYHDVSPYPAGYREALESTRSKLSAMPARPSLEVLSVTGGSAHVVLDQ